MAKAVRKTPARNKAKAAKSAKPAAPRRKKVARRKKSPSALKRLEGAILKTVAEADELAVEMGLAGAVPPRNRKRTK